MIQNLIPTLKTRLESARCVAVLGIGSDLHGDDAVGLMALAALRKELERTPLSIPCHLVEGGVAPENQTGAIRAVEPSHVVLIDAADLHAAVGAARVIEEDEVVGLTSSTHSMPLSVLMQFLRVTMSVEVILIGIQPASLAFGGSVHQDLVAGAQRVATALVKALS